LNPSKYYFHYLERTIHHDAHRPIHTHPLRREKQQQQDITVWMSSL